ncbi:MAG: EVE domain-containing protein [Sphingomonadales bacterium]|jgi:predicted RNA-binding protein with PUA-like domain|nr:EVE domain-containing protein [Sphingomonadales bacterium]
MAHWLMKSEPFKYSWDDLVRDGRTFWNGVRNNQAALYLKAMAVGDEVIFYHSNEGLAAIGIMQVVQTAYPDPSDEKGRFVMVDVAPLRPLARPVTLAEMKAEPRLEGMKMFQQFRLSVVPLTDAEWDVILEMGEG